MTTAVNDARKVPDARLLVVEDEPNILELLSASLRYAGFEVITAGAGTEAVQAAQRHRPAAPAEVRRPGTGRGQPRGVARWRADPAVADRVQAAALLHGQRQPGAVQVADPRPRLGLRLPW